MEDDGPYQPQGQLWVSIGDVIVPDINQFDLKGGIFVYEQTWVWSKRKKAKCKQTKQGGKANGIKYTFNTMCKMAIRDLSVFEEVQGDLHILQLVEAHPSLLPWLQETRGRQASGGGCFQSSASLCVSDKDPPWCTKTIAVTFCFLFVWLFFLTKRERSKFEA